LGLRSRYERLKTVVSTSEAVFPAKAETQRLKRYAQKSMGSRLRGNDDSVRAAGLWIAAVCYAAACAGAASSKR
jgi:hypothetical protein